VSTAEHIAQMVAVGLVLPGDPWEGGVGQQWLWLSSGQPRVFGT
jgi:hypothetical protein